MQSLSRTNVLGVEVIRGDVLSQWIDINNHMNVAYYILAFDLAVDSLWDRFGITQNHVNVAQSSTFAVESHITWQREMALGDAFVITTQVLAYDDKRIHQLMRMYHRDKGYLASTAEWLNLHVDLSVRRVSPWPSDILERIATFADSQGEWEWPSEVGKQITLPNAIFSTAERG